MKTHRYLTEPISPRCHSRRSACPGSWVCWVPLCDIICVLVSQIAHQKKSTSPKSSKQTKSSFLWCSFCARRMTWKPLKTHSWGYPSAHQVRKKWAHLVTFIITSTALLHDLFIGVCQLLQGQNKNPRCCRGYLHAPKASPTYPANGPYHHISTSRPIKQAPPKNITKRLMCCMFPSPENLPYRHLYPDGIAWQWGDRPFNTGVAIETPNMSSKTSDPFKIWGEAGEREKKKHTHTHTKKTIDWGKKKNMEETPTKTGTFLISASVALEETPKIA